MLVAKKAAEEAAENAGEPRGPLPNMDLLALVTLQCDQLRQEIEDRLQALKEKVGRLTPIAVGVDCSDNVWACSGPKVHGHVTRSLF